MAEANRRSFKERINNVISAVDELRSNTSTTANAVADTSMPQTVSTNEYLQGCFPTINANRRPNHPPSSSSSSTMNRVSKVLYVSHSIFGLRCI